MTLQYISVTDIPLIGPDRFDTAAKQRAAEAAEQKLEADVNDGGTFASTTPLHEQAIAAWATYILATGPVEPTSAQSGLNSGGAADDQAEFASELKSIYQSNRQSILSSEGDDSADSSGFVLSV
jgi:hypothetical protein